MQLIASAEALEMVSGLFARRVPVVSSFIGTEFTTSSLPLYSDYLDNEVTYFELSFRF